MKPQIISALVVAGLILLFSFAGTRLQDAGLIGGEPERVTGVIAGLVLVWFGNLMPKSAPDAQCTAEQACAFRTKRFAGVAFMIGGLAHAAIWLLAPADIMSLASTVPVVAALALIGIKVLRSRTTTIV